MSAMEEQRGNRDNKHFPFQMSVPTGSKDHDDLWNSQERDASDIQRNIDLLSPSQNICEASKRSSIRNKDTNELKVIGVESAGPPRILNKIVLKDLINENSVMRLNEQYIEIKGNEFFCKVCKICVKYEGNVYSLRRHLFRDHNDLLVQRALDFVSKRNHNVNNRSEESDKFCSVLRKIDLDVKFMSHTKYIENNGHNFVCILCKDIITFTTCGKYVEMHFFKAGHLKKTHEISVPLMKELPDNNLNLKSKNKKSKTQTNLIGKIFNTNGIKLQHTMKETDYEDKNLPRESVLDRRELKILKLGLEQNLEIRINSQFLTRQDEKFFCTACQMFIHFENSKRSLLRHCISKHHNELLIQNASEYMWSEGVCPDYLKQAGSDLSLQKFHELVSKVLENDPHDVTYSHILFLIITNSCADFPTSWVSCYLCNKSIEFSECGLENHFLSSQHTKNTFELNCKSVSHSKKTNSIYKQPLPHCIEVAENPKNEKVSESRQLIVSHHVPQKEYRSKEFKYALSKVLESAEYSLHKVIENNKQFVELKNDEFFCIICKANISGKQIKGRQLKSIAIHFNSKEHNELKEVLENASTVEKPILTNPDSSDVSKALGQQPTQPDNSNVNFSAQTKSKYVEKSRAVPAVTVKTNKMSRKNAHSSCNIESNQNNGQWLTLILRNLPCELKEFEYTVELTDDTIHCKICSFKFLLKSTLSDASNTLMQHLSEHLAFKIELLMGTNAFASFLPSAQQCIKENIKHLEMLENSLCCSICQLKLCRKRAGLFSDSSEIVQDHFNGKKHKRNFTAMKF